MPNDIGRVFVVGCPRSGTTLVQSLLAAHSRITSFTESHLFDKGFLNLGSSSIVRPEPLRHFVAKFVSENPHLPESARARLLRCDQLRTADEIARDIVASLDEAALACGAKFWVEKTPDHVFRIPLIRSVAPGAKFIHVIRRADGVLPSLYVASRKWGRNKSWLSCALHWTVAVWKSAIYAHGPAHFLVTYEDLLEHQNGLARAMIGWLGLNWEESVSADYASSAAQCIAPGEAWKAANLQTSRPTPTATSLRAPFFARAITRLGPYERLRRRSVHV